MQKKSNSTIHTLLEPSTAILDMLAKAAGSATLAEGKYVNKVTEKRVKE